MWRLLPGAALLLLPTIGWAHPAQFTTMQFTVAPGGEFRASLNVDVLAFALGKPSIEAGNEELEALLDGPREALAGDLDAAGEQFRREVVVHTDIGDAATTNWRFPGLPEIDSALASHVVPRILIGGEITFSGVLPRGTRGVSVRLPYVLGAVVHFYTVPGGKGEGQLVSPGEYSNLVKITTPPLPPSPPARVPVARHVPAFGLRVASMMVVVFLLWVCWHMRRTRYNPSEG